MRVECLKGRKIGVARASAAKIATRTQNACLLSLPACAKVLLWAVLKLKRRSPPLQSADLTLLIEFALFGAPTA